MKRILKGLIILLFLFPIFLNAETKRTYTNNITVANNYISKFSDRNKYFIFPAKYKYSHQRDIVEEPSFINGGILSEYEYYTTRYSERIGYNTYYYSYLGIGKEYWVDYLYTVDNDISSGQKSSSYKAGTRVTEYVKPGIEIKGKGTYGSPWEFREGYYIDIIPNSESYGTVTPRTKMAKPGETVTINIVPAPGFEYKGNDDCRLNRVGTTDRYTINNISRDVSCVVVFEAKTYEFNLVTTEDGETPASPNKLYYRPGKGFYSDSALTNKVTRLTTKPTVPGYQFDGFTYEGETIISSEGVVYQNIPNLNSNQSTQNLKSSFKNSQLMANPSLTGSIKYLQTDIDKEKIEKITFTTSLGTHVVNGTDCWDVSKEKNGTVLAWATDTDNNGLYEFTIGSKGKIYASEGRYLFAHLNNLKSFVGMQYFDTSLLSDMSYMFFKCKSLTSLDLNYFDTSKVTNMASMFAGSDNGGGAMNLIQINGLNRFDTSKVKNMDGMFNNCSKLTSLDVSSFNTSNVTNMYYMFGNCSSLTSLNVSNFNTSNVTNMVGMFNKCASLTSLNVSNFNTSNVTSMTSMFSGCSNLTSLNLSNFNTSKVTNMTSMFYGCSKLNSLNVSSFDTSNVINMYMMFSYCSNLTSLNLSNFNTSKVTDMSDMFNNCSKLTTLNVSSFNTSKVSKMIYMFAFCTNLESLDISSFDTSNVTDMSYMFEYMTNVKNIRTGPNFNTSNVTSFKLLFAGCNNLSFDFSKLDTSSAIYMNRMFDTYGTNTGKILDLRGFNTSNVTDMMGMFASVKSSSIRLDDFDFSKVAYHGGNDYYDSSQNIKMFQELDSNTVIYVKDTASKNFIEARLQEAGLSNQVIAVH